MEDQQCPRCKTTKYRNPSLKLMVNVCGHSLCESCIELLFIRGAGACPECGIPLRRSNFRLQLFEDAFVEKEVDIRRKILKDYNKKEEDFVNLNEYNDYLEQIETIVFNLANNIDVEATRKDIEQYKKDNKDLIVKNRSKLSRDQEYIEMLIEQEQQYATFHKTINQEEEMNKSRDEEYIEMLIEQEQQSATFHKAINHEEEMKDKLNKIKQKQNLIDELMFSDSTADEIVTRHKATVQAEMMENEGPYKKTVFTAERGGTNGITPMQLDDAPLYEYVDLVLVTGGPTIPTTNDITELGYLNHMRKASSQDLSGGYRASYGCQRAIMDAFNGLCFTVDLPPSIDDPAV